MIAADPKGRYSTASSIMNERLGGVVAEDHLLLAVPAREQKSFDVAGDALYRSDDFARVIVGLQQAGDEDDLQIADRGGHLFVAEELQGFVAEALPVLVVRLAAVVAELGEMYETRFQLRVVDPQAAQ